MSNVLSERVLKRYKGSSFTIRSKAVALFLFCLIFSVLLAIVGVLVISSTSDLPKLVGIVIFLTAGLTMGLVLFLLKGLYRLTAYLVSGLFALVSIVGIAMTLVHPERLGSYSNYLFVMICTILITAIFSSRKMLLLVSITLTVTLIAFFISSQLLFPEFAAIAINGNVRFSAPLTLVLLATPSYISQNIMKSAILISEEKSLESEASFKRITDLFHHTRKAVDQLIPNISKTANLTSLVQVSSAEQKSGIEQISNAIMQLNTITQSNVAVAEKISDEAQTLQAQSEQLSAMVEA